MKKKLWIGLLVICLWKPALAQIHPWDMIQRMRRGINIGNTMDAPTEGQWQAPVQEFYFDDYLDAGFTCVRIPIRWDNYMQSTPPYSIDSSWLDRVEQVIDWSLNRGLVTIINAHHDDWLYTNFPENLPRFESLWQQVASRFKDKSENLLFEIINEPYFDLSRAEIDTLNQTILSIIRQTNPTRIVIITGGGNDTSPRLTSYLVVEHLVVPDDPYVMAYFHYYKPRGFTNTEGGNQTDTWGSAQDKAEVDAHFDMVKSWVNQNNVPMLLGEFGVDNAKPLAPRLEWYRYITEGALRRGFCFTLWSAGPTAGKYTYLRQKGAWIFEQLNAITGQKPFSDSLVVIPAIVEAENFDYGGNRVAYLDNDSSNTLGYYRPEEGVEIDSVAAGNYAVHFDNPGEWLEFSLNVDSAATYTIAARVAAVEADRKFSIQFNNTNSTGQINVPATGSLDNFVTVSDTIFLPAGFQVMRIVAETAGLAMDNLLFSLVVASDANNLLINPGFEQGTTEWTPKQCALTIVDSLSHSGNASLKVSERTKIWAGPFQNIKDRLLESGQGYYLASGFFRAVSDTGVIAKVKVRLTYGGEDHHIGALGKIDTTGWTFVSDTLLLTWQGELEDANFFIQTANASTADFYVDDVSLKLDSLITTAVAADNHAPVLREYWLQNYPNPFNSVTTITINLPKSGHISGVIYDILGRKIKVLTDEFKEKGQHKLEWNGTDMHDVPVSSGIYFARLKAGDVVRVRKLMLVR